MFRSVLTVACVAALGTSTVDAASLTIEWDPSTDGGLTVGYLVFYGTGPGASSAQVDVGSDVKFHIEGLLEATTYCLSVRAYNARGDLSAPSSEVCATTPAALTPSTPPAEGTPVSTVPCRSAPSAGEITLHASEARVVRGHWSAASSSSAAGGRTMRTTDTGFAAADAPVAAPENFFEMRFEAAATTPYRVWLRLRAGSNSKWNDSVWVQFSDALVNGSPAHRIGTTSALAVNLEPCAGCGPEGWGWSNSTYWLSQHDTVTFAESGTHTIRVQTREDGVDLDQIVLSATKYLSAPPGAVRNDSRLLSELLPSPLERTPYSGRAIPLPGTIEAAHVDQGSAGIAYADTTAGNAGSSFRAIDVDVEPSSVGGYNIGWTAANEWVAYSVHVDVAGTYAVQFRVASPTGGALYVSAGAPSSAASEVPVPQTGAWQTWTTVSVPMRLEAGPQVMMVRFLTGGINLRSITVQ